MENQKYYLISYGYHYGNSGSTSHAITATKNTPIEFITDKIKDGKRRDPDLNQFHIISSIEITEKEYDYFHSNKNLL